MKNKLKSLNFILAVLLVLVLGTGCGRQKAIELPTSDEAVVAVSEEAASEAAVSKDTSSQSKATEDKTASSVDKSEATGDKTDSSVEKSEAAGDKTASSVDKSEATGDKPDNSVDKSETTENKTNSSNDASGISGLSEIGGSEPGGTESEEVVTSVIFEDGVYTSKEDVARYISEFGHLPQNFITKKEAQALGWPGGSLEKYAPGKCIGGDRFGNYEGLLPEEKGRKYYECDIDTLGKDKRGAKRIIYSNDGLIFYTDDHYKSFTQLYGIGLDD